MNSFLASLPDRRSGPRVRFTPLSRALLRMGYPYGHVVLVAAVQPCLAAEAPRPRTVAYAAGPLPSRSVSGAPRSTAAPGRGSGAPRRRATAVHHPQHHQLASARVGQLRRFRRQQFAGGLLRLRGHFYRVQKATLSSRRNRIGLRAGFRCDVDVFSLLSSRAVVAA